MWKAVLISLGLLVAVIAYAGTATAAPPPPPPPPSDLSIHSDNVDLETKKNRWGVTVRNGAIHSNADAAMRDVKIQLTIEPASVLKPTGWIPLSISAGRIDPKSGIWTIPYLPASATATARFLATANFTFTHLTEDTIIRYEARIISSAPEEPPSYQSNNVTEVYDFLERGATTSQWILGDLALRASIIGQSDREATIDIRTANASTRDTRGLLSTRNDRLYDVRIRIDLSPGLHLKAIPAGVTIRDADTFVWEAGTVRRAGSMGTFPNLEVTVIASEFPSLEAVPLEQRCLTATVEHARPAFPLDQSKKLNDVTEVCMAPRRSLLSRGEVDLFWVEDCVNSPGPRCRSGDTLKLLVGTGLGTRFRDPDHVYLQLGDLIGRSYDGHADSVTDGTTVSWQTHPGEFATEKSDKASGTIRFVDQLANLAGTKQHWDNYGPFVVTAKGWNGGNAPGTVRLRFANLVHTRRTVFYDPKPVSTEDYSFGNSDETAFLVPVNFFVEFSALGTYVLNYKLSATHTDTKTYSDDANYTFHVGPVSELEVRDAGAGSPLAPAGRAAYTIEAANNGPDAAPMVEVALTGVPQGSSVIVSDGEYVDAPCAAPLGGTSCWKIGQVHHREVRQIDGDLEAPTLTVIPPQGAATPRITASVRNMKDYVVTIDGETHSTHYFDYIEENSTDIEITAREGTGAGAAGQLSAPSLRKAADPSLVIVSWDQVERLYRFGVSHYEVHEAPHLPAQGCVRPPLNPPASQIRIVRGELYVDVSLQPGQDKCYAVRAVNSRDHKGYWSPVVSTLSGLILSESVVTVSEDRGKATYTAKLSRQPEGDVTVKIAVADPTAATVNPSRLTFTASNWNEEQTVTVTGVDDSIDNPDNRRNTAVNHTVTGGGYDDARQALRVEVTDNDGAHIRVVPTSVSVAENDEAAFGVSLNTAPTADVTITVASADSSIASVSPATLTFTADNFFSPQTVTVTGVDDDLINEGRRRETTLTLTAANGGYDDALPQEVSVAVSDDEEGGIAVSPTSMSVAEDGGTGSFDVSLQSEPSGDVTVLVTSADASVAMVSPAALTFTTTNWSTAQTVTVSGVNDELINPNGRRVTTITLEASGGGYHYVEQQRVTVTATDDDRPAGPPRLSFDEAMSGPDEGDGAVIVRVNLNQAVRSTIWVLYELHGSAKWDSDGDCTGGNGDGDYTLTYVKIPKGETTANFEITLCNDTVDERDETIVITLLEDRGVYEVGDIAEHTLTIMDDD